MGLKRPISYQWRLFLPLVALLWAIIIIMATVQYQREKRALITQLNDDLSLINSRIINAYDNDIDLDPFMMFLGEYYRDSELSGIRVSVYNDEGKLLYNIGEPINDTFQDHVSPEIIEANETGSGTALRKSDTMENNPYYYFGVNTSSDGKIYVHTAMPYTMALSRSLAVDGGMWIVIVIMAVAATIVAYMSTRYIGQNIRILRDFANRTAAGDFNVDDMPEFPHDELGDISRQIVVLYSDAVEANERSEREHRIALKASEEKMRVTKQLTDNINHELKTPVGVIKGYLDTIAEHPEMDEAGRMRFIQKARSHVDRLVAMLADLSSITRLESGGGSVMREFVDFHELVSNLATEIDTANLAGNLQFKYDIPPKCEVIGNYGLLYGMLANLVRNASFHSKGTECGIKLIGSSQRDYRFAFYDDGTGVGEEHLPHLFDRFYRIDKGRSRKMGGTGLGLPIVKNTVTVMGGTIMVHNRPEGGLEFVFTLLRWGSNLS